MLYALAVISRWFCPPKHEQPAGGAELQPTPVPAPADPIAPPNSPVIQPVAQPVAQPVYPDLPTLNPSIVRADDDTYSV